MAALEEMHEQVLQALGLGRMVSGWRNPMRSWGKG